jgi:DNA-binding NtrC family response regulator
VRRRKRRGILRRVEISPQLHDVVQSANNAGSKQIIVILGPNVAIEGEAVWDLLRSGASDVLIWTDLDKVVKQVQARFERWLGVERLLESKVTEDLVVGRSGAWRAALCRIVGIARFSDSSTLILGESGTGKEVAAKLIHQMDARAGKRDLVVQDCSTLVQDLSGSEFFGHERGAFTGAMSDRQGAFALAHGGTLFLDEIGELPLQVQAQLLRAIQEGTYKRVGGTTWHRTNFRLICATNRNLEAMVSSGEFRADLYHPSPGTCAGFLPCANVWKTCSRSPCPSFGRCNPIERCRRSTLRFAIISCGAITRATCANSSKSSGVY